MKAGLATGAMVSQVSGFTLRDAVHAVMSMGTRTWTVKHIRSGEPTAFFSEGSYLLRPRAGAEPTLYIHTGSWQRLGVYGRVALPEGFPAVEFRPGVNQIAVVPSSSAAPKVGRTEWEPSLRVSPPAPPAPPTGFSIL